MEIVVGIDGSTASDAALAWALEEARLRGARVVALLAYSYLDQPHLPGEAAFDPEYSRAEAERVLGAIVQRVAGDSDVEIEHRIVVDLPARALLEASADADLLVIGSRGRGGFKGLLLGSVSQQVVTHAQCPVVVHRPTAAAAAGRTP